MRLVLRAAAARKFDEPWPGHFVRAGIGNAGVVYMINSGTPPDPHWAHSYNLHLFEGALRELTSTRVTQPPNQAPRYLGPASQTDKKPGALSEKAVLIFFFSHFSPEPRTCSAKINRSIDQFFLTSVFSNFFMNFCMRLVWLTPLEGRNSPASQAKRISLK